MDLVLSHLSYGIIERQYVQYLFRIQAGFTFCDLNYLFLLSDGMVYGYIFRKMMWKMKFQMRTKNLFEVMCGWEDE